MHALVRLNRAVAVGQARGGDAGLEALVEVDPSTPRFDAVAGHLHERAGDRQAAARHYTEAARRAGSAAERDHLAREAARLAAAAVRPPDAVRTCSDEWEKDGARPRDPRPATSTVV